MLDLQNDDIHRNAKQVLKTWNEIELSNLRRVASGIQSFTLPCTYQTNQPRTQAEISQSPGRAETMGQALDNLKDILSWITDQYYSNGDMEHAFLGVMFLRYLFPGQDVRFGLRTSFINYRLNEVLARGGYLYAGADSLNNMIIENLRATGRGPAVGS